MDKPRRAWLGITKKVVMAITGLGLCLFLVGHLAGNTLLIYNLGWFNNYANTLNAIPILPIIEIGLAAMFLLHAYEGLLVWRQNKAARPVEYQGGKHWSKEKSGKSRKTTSSTTMMVTGVIILAFTAMHVWHFKYYHSIGEENPISQTKAGDTAPGVGVMDGSVTPSEPEAAKETAQATHDLGLHVVYELKKPLVAIIYMASMLALGFHLFHAVWSAFQTLGATNSKVRKFMIAGGKAFSIIIAGGFFLLPVWVWFFLEVPK